MVLVKKTYLSGCTWCGALGTITRDKFVNFTTPLTIPCPVCNGAKTIPITEEYESPFQVTLAPEKPIEIDLSKLKTLHDQFKETKLNVWKLPVLLKTRRKYFNISLRTLSKEIGLSISTISRIENGKCCMAHNYKTLLDYWENYGKK
jgi:DNA-binding XRE family transcriptional regulator